MSYYRQYPNLEECAVGERVKHAQSAVLSYLQKGVCPEAALGTIEGYIEKEQYEMAEGVAAAVAAFRANPQLSIF